MSKLDIILLTFTDKWWDWERSGFNYRTAEIASRLSRHRLVSRMLVVGVPTSRIRGAMAGDGASEGNRGFHVSKVDDRVYVLDHTRWIPRERHSPAAHILNAAIHNRALESTIRNTARTLGMRNIVVLHAGPLTLAHAGRLGELVSAYDGRDDWLVHPAYRRMRGRIERGYEGIRDKTDVAFVVSEGVAQRFRGARTMVEVLPNAVASEYAAPYAGVVPEELRSMQRPIVGYLGAIQERVDVELLDRLAVEMPEASLCLVGPVLNEAHIAPLARRSNVHLLGRKDHAVIREYTEAFDIAVMPHTDTDLTRRMDPLKLYEYVACAKPTVCTGVPVDGRFDGLVRTASGPGQFIEYVRSAARGEWGVSAEAAKRFIEENNWDNRVDCMLNTIVGAIQEKAGFQAGDAKRLGASA